MSLLLSIEGPIGAGKTSLTRILEREIGFKGFYELSFKNPYLSKFYNDIERYSFPIQIEFLASRFKQWKRIQNVNVDTVCDYFFYKDEIFARMNLKGEDFKLYRRIFNLMIEHIRPPDYVIYLSARPAVLLERIEKRGREYESPITLEYLMKLCSFYDEYLKDYRLSPVLILDVEGFDYVNNERDRMHIILEVRRFTGYYG